MAAIRVEEDCVFIKFDFVMPHKNKLSKGSKEFVSYAAYSTIKNKISRVFHLLINEQGIKPKMFEDKVVFCIRHHYPIGYKPSKTEPTEISDCDNFEIKPLIDSFTGIFYLDDSGSCLSIFQEKVRDDSEFPYTEIAIWKRSSFFEQNGNIFMD